MAGGVRAEDGGNGWGKEIAGGLRDAGGDGLLQDGRGQDIEQEDAKTRSAQMKKHAAVLYNYTEISGRIDEDHSTTTL